MAQGKDPRWLLMHTERAHVRVQIEALTPAKLKVLGRLPPWLAGALVLPGPAAYDVPHSTAKGTSKTFTFRHMCATLITQYVIRHKQRCSPQLIGEANADTQDTTFLGEVEAATAHALLCCMHCAAENNDYGQASACLLRSHLSS